MATAKAKKPVKANKSAKKPVKKKTVKKTAKKTVSKAPDFQVMTKQRQRIWNNFINASKVTIVISIIILGAMAIFLV